MFILDRLPFPSTYGLLVGFVTWFDGQDLCISQSVSQSLSQSMSFDRYSSLGEHMDGPPPPLPVFALSSTKCHMTKEDQLLTAASISCKCTLLRYGHVLK